MGGGGSHGRFGRGGERGHGVMVEVEAEPGRGTCAGKGDRQLQARAVAFEEGVEGFENEAFPAGDHVRGAGLCADHAAEIEGF